MPYLIALLLSLSIAALATLTGLDRSRAFYPTVLIVVGSYYVLFAAMAATRQTTLVEIVVAVGFVLVALVGFKANLWLVVAGLVAHGLFDFVHHRFIANPGVPAWWPAFCLSFDVSLGAWLAVRLIRSPAPALE
jgi:hypothetical protein